MRVVPGTLSTFSRLMTPAPAVRAYWYVPRLKLGEFADFMVDTGASGTVLNGIYGVTLQRHMRPRTISHSQGVGGRGEYFYEDAVVVFLDDKQQLYSRRVRLGVQRLFAEDYRDPEVLYLPCLVGRDIINACAFHFDYSQQDIRLVFP